MQLKEFTDQTCPECKKTMGLNEGSSIAADEGSFFFCPYCGAPSLLIYNGARFMRRPRDPAFKVIVVYEISGDTLNNGHNGLICCIEVKKIHASPLNKVNKNYYQYWTRKEIILFMNENYREDL